MIVKISRVVSSMVNEKMGTENLQQVRMELLVRRERLKTYLDKIDNNLKVVSKIICEREGHKLSEITREKLYWLPIENKPGLYRAHYLLVKDCQFCGDLILIENIRENDEVLRTPKTKQFVNNGE
jgi:hypothetical protein